MVAALALPAMAQFGDQQQPNNQFQSTSTMVGSGSTYSSTPTINAGGTANAPTYGGGGPNRAVDPISGSDVMEWYIDNDLIDEPFDTPLGDAVWPLLLCAAAFAAFFALRRRKVKA